MRKAGFYPTPSTISTILGLCSQLDLGELGVQVHGLGIKTGNCSNVVTGTTLIDMQVHGQVIREGLELSTYLVATLLTMYSECGSSEDFYKMCPTISIDDQISWNSVIAGFYRLGNDKEALDWFIRMRQACIHIDFFTLSNVLSSTGILSALSEGK
ncbi:hypothetical protein MKX01_026288 [Papaver californicum]|nr:hypothetical protein MKX01_026288 [Papaver californicum]